MENETTNPKFTQRHYEYLARALTHLNNPILQHQITYFLAEALEKDNPKFNREKFIIKSIPSLTP